MSVPPESSPERVGLCQSCQHTRRIVSAKGSAFWMCLRSQEDPRFRKYPPLPVLRCSGYERQRA